MLLIVMVLVFLQIWLATPAMATGGACLPPDPIDRPSGLGSIASDTYPVRVHWLRDQDEVKAAIILDYAEISWAVQVDQMGFVPPLLPDDADGPELDFYLAPTWNGGGVTYGDDRVDHMVGDGMNSTTSFIVIHWDYPIMGLASLVPHEFQHTLQFATDFEESTYPIWEAVATASQEWTLGPGEESYWDWNIASYQEAPWLPALTADGYYASQAYGLGWSYEYGSVLWVMHLDQVLGASDGAAGPSLWRAVADEGAGLEPDVLEAFASVAEKPLGDALNELARTRWLVGDDWDSRGLLAAEFWPDAFKVPTDNATFNDLPLEHAPNPQPQSTGQSFLSVTGLATADPTASLVVQVRSDSELESALLVLWWSVDGQLGEETAYGLDPQVSLPVDGLDRVVIALTNLGPPGYDPDVDPLYAFGDQFLTIFTEVPDPETPETTETTDTFQTFSDTHQPRPTSASACACTRTVGAVGGWPWLLLFGAFRRRTPRRS